MDKNYSFDAVNHILQLRDLEKLLLQKIDSVRKTIIKNRKLSKDLPEGIEFFIMGINSDKECWADWRLKPGNNGLVPVGPGAVERVSYILVKEYIKIVYFDRKYSEFSVLPPGFGKNYEKAQDALVGLDASDLPDKESTLDSIIIR